MAEEIKSKWLKVLKLFGEFVVAAITALIATNCVGRFY